MGEYIPFPRKVTSLCWFNNAKCSSDELVTIELRENIRLLYQKFQILTIHC